MTTPELLDLIRRDADSHAHCDDDQRMRWHFPSGCVVTIGTLAHRAGVPRRDIEEAVQQARLDGAPIVTGDQGIAIATSAAQMLDQYRRLRSRYVHQAVTARAVLRTAKRMKAAEDAAARLTLWEAA